jgi:hypothetical protein
MRSRTRASRDVRRAALAGAVALAALLLACPHSGPEGGAEAPAAPQEHVVTIFSHARHGAARMAKVAGGDLDAQCRYCHADIGGGKRLANPPEDSCYACHARADRAAPSAEACGLCHLRAPEAAPFVAAVELRKDPPHDPRFYHESHREEHCANCHATAAAPAPRDNPGLTAPALCASCHGAVRFSHETHVVGARLDCAGCHAAEPALSRARACPKCGRAVAGEGASCPRCGEKLPPRGPEKAGVARLMPSHKDCVPCHPGLVAEVPNKDCAFCHAAVRLDFAGPHEVPKLARGDLINFSHEDHARASCATCHTGESARREGIAAAPPTMEGCRECHAGLASFQGKPVPSSCATCHAVLRGPLAPVDHGELVRPIDHTEGFRRHHGEPARDPGNKCGECHDLETSCKTCHALEEPASHTLRWKRSAHGEAMAHDRETCVLCHQANFCSDCHSLRQPPDHKYTPNFVQGGEGHRLAARREIKRCFVCHSFGPDCSRCHP